MAKPITLTQTEEIQTRIYSTYDTFTKIEIHEKIIVLGKSRIPS